MTSIDQGGSSLDLKQWLSDAWAHTPDAGTIFVEGVPIAYRLWGAPTGRQCLVFVHGFRAHSRWWDHIAPHFVDNFKVLALDLSGMGDSGNRHCYSREQHAREVLAVITGLRMERAIIVGHSYGGIVSLIACHLAPELILRSIIIDSALVGRSSAETEIAIRPARQFRSLEEGVARYRLIPPGGWPNPEIMRYLALRSLRPNGNHWTWKFDPNAPRSMNGDDFSRFLVEPLVPLDYVYGAMSEILPTGTVARLHQVLPNCRRCVPIAASHHHIMIEQPFALVSALAELLAEPCA
jgi:pimeloyl-ACP methyl ester carboxylesterase